MLTTNARAFYGKPALILEASSREGVRSACREIERKVKPKDGERVVLVAYRKRMEEA